MGVAGVSWPPPQPNTRKNIAHRKQEGRPKRDGPIFFSDLSLVSLGLRALPVDQVAQRGAAAVARGGGGGGGTGVAALGALLTFLVALDLSAAGLFANGTDAQADLLLFLVHLDDLELVLRVHIHRFGLGLRQHHP